MNIDEVNDFFNKKALKIKFQFSTEPLYATMKEENIERYKEIPLVNRSKILNLKVISKSDEFNDFYISVIRKLILLLFSIICTENTLPISLHTKRFQQKMICTELFYPC